MNLVLFDKGNEIADALRDLGYDDLQIWNDMDVLNPRLKKVAEIHFGKVGDKKLIGYITERGFEKNIIRED